MPFMRSVLKWISSSIATFTVTTTGAQTLTINSFGVSRDCVVEWGDGSSNIYTGTAQRTHNYAGAGTWTVTIRDPLAVTIFDIRDAKVTLNSVGIRSMSNVTTFLATALNAGTFNSADVTAWRPTDFRLYSMPAGYAGTFNSADVAAWRPTDFYLLSMPIATFTITITANGFAAWATLANFQMQGNALLQAQVNAILWDLYQATIVPRTATVGTINISGTNAAPSGTYQACASCPVTSATPGKEIAYELINDSCAVGFNKWATVTFTA